MRRCAASSSGGPNAVGRGHPNRVLAEWQGFLMAGDYPENTPGVYFMMFFCGVE